jgi:hypothetical protein
VHLVGFTIGIYHDARTYECQISHLLAEVVAVTEKRQKERSSIQLKYTLEVKLRRTGMANLTHF